MLGKLNLGKWINICSIYFIFTSFSFSETLYVSNQGNDKNIGTKKNPIASLQKAVAMATENLHINEIVIAEGRYEGAVVLEKLENSSKEKLVIRAEKDEKGEYRKVILDGGYYIREAEAVENYRGVFKAKLPKSYNYYRHRPDMAELDTRIRYTRVADFVAIVNYPASFEVIDKELYFHTSDSKAASSHMIAGNFKSSGFNIRRNNVIIQGLQLKNCGFGINAEDVTLENCSVWNVRRVAYYIGGGSKNVIVRNCLAEDVGGAFYSEGKYTTIENCRGFRRKGPFESTYRQEKGSGVQLYSPAQYGVIKGNLMVGFRTGIFVKASIQHVVIENNTVVDGESAGIGCTIWYPKSIMRNNIVYGFKRPLLVDTLLKPRSSTDGVIIENNAIWENLSDDLEKVSLEIPLKAGVGYRNIKANPCFVSIENEDFRLLPESPLARFLPGGKPIGALPVVKKVIDRDAPKLSLSIREPALLLNTMVKKYFAKDPWNMGLPPGTAGVPRFESSEVIGDGNNRWVIPGNEAVLILSANDNLFKIKQMRFKWGSQPWSQAKNFQAVTKIQLPKGKDEMELKVRVSDAAGNWSSTQRLLLYQANAAPRLHRKPTVFKNKEGMMVHFETNVPTHAVMEYGNTPECKKKMVGKSEYIRYWSAGDGGEWIYEKSSAKKRHQFSMIPKGEDSNRKFYYRFILDDGVGHKVKTEVYKVELSGVAKKYYVDAKQTNIGDGSQENPFSKIQTAVDRALPGDEVILKGGFYHESVYLDHGGVAGAPLVIRADDGEKVYMDGKQSIEYLWRLVKADHVTIRGIEMRWFKHTAVLINESRNVWIDQCRFWNKHWGKGWATGNAFSVSHSPKFKLTHSLLISMNGGGQLFFSPEFEISNCTGNHLLHRGVRLIYSCRNSVFKNNSFTFTGNDHLSVLELKKNWETFECDYNNFAAYVRKGAERRPPKHEDIAWKDIPGVRAWIKQCKHINILRLGWGHGSKKYKVYSMDEWREKSGGKDKHSIYKLPMYVDPIKHDYRLQEGSPNINSGENGIYIGAYAPMK